VVGRLYPGTVCLVRGDIDRTASVKSDRMLILLYIALEILKMLSEQKAEVIAVSVYYKGDIAKIVIGVNEHKCFKGSGNASPYFSSLCKNAQVGGGRVKIKRTSKNKININLVIPIV
jgi:hypothetical protein